MNCNNCSVCKGRDFNSLGIEVAEKEVIPFFKREVLDLKYHEHPLPFKYKGLLSSLLCYSQALAYNRAHSIESSIYYTDNKWMLKHSEALNEKFNMRAEHISKVPANYSEACEFNVNVN